jgi:hypothetical protein
MQFDVSVSCHCEVRKCDAGLGFSGLRVLYVYCLRLIIKLNPSQLTVMSTIITAETAAVFMSVYSLHKMHCS